MSDIARWKQMADDALEQHWAGGEEPVGPGVSDAFRVAVRRSKVLARELRAAAEQAEVIEIALRRELWLTHGHPYPALYGDDGEMWCNACPFDFKREPIGEVQRYTLITRAALAEKVRISVDSRLHDHPGVPGSDDCWRCKSDRSLDDLERLAESAAGWEATAGKLAEALTYYAERRNHTTKNDGTPHLWTNDSYDGEGPGARARTALVVHDRQRTRTVG